MAFVMYNANPVNNLVIDCPVRAISKVTGQDWDTCYIGIAVEGFVKKNMPNSDSVWGSYLRQLGFVREVIPNFCPDCYTVRDFCHDHPKGEYLLSTNGHTVAVVDGDYYDTWDSGDAVPIYYWFKGE